MTRSIEQLAAHIEPLPGPPATPVRSALARVAAPAVVVAAVLVGSGVLGQLATPYVRRDDWPFLLPPGTPGVGDPIDKVRGEGRWLSYAWWFVVGQHATPVFAVVVMFTAWVLFAVGLWRLFGVRGQVSSALFLLALVLSPIWVRLVYWPGTLAASTVVAAAGVWTLPAAAGRRGWLATWTLVVTALAVLTYPPVTGLLLIAAAAHLRDRPWRELWVQIVMFGAGFGLGLAVSFALNRMAFGDFGVAIAAWRHPNALHSLQDLEVNGRRYVHQLRTLAGTVRWAAAVGVLATMVALTDLRVRTAVLKVGSAVVVVAALECAQTLDTGVRTNVRGSGWVWLAIVIPAGLLLSGRPWSRRAGRVALAALVLLGGLAWRADLAAHQATERSYAGIVSAAARPGKAVVFYQRASERSTSRGRITAGTLRAMFYADAGVVVRWCRPAECRELGALVGQGRVHDLGTVTGVIVPAPPRVL